MKLKDWLNVNRNTFLERDLRFLLKQVFPNRHLPFCFAKDVRLERENIRHLEEIKRLYVSRMPLAYILGKEEFFGYEFQVAPSTLIPRKETEIIVERAIELIQKESLSVVLDLCCGCANIGIVIKKVFAQTILVYCSDVSFAALQVAKGNREQTRADVKLINSDLLESFRENCFDLIISNPPYVESDQIRGSLVYEPREALCGGKDGMDYIEEILRTSKRYVKRSGYIIIEIGYNQKRETNNLVDRYGYGIVDWIKDYSGNWRGVILKKSSE
ncbi:MAG: peptide chain release factor N(5)-glutamine methyltransferase [Candidatus Omnitrophota bacterium]|nr:MAG: peptide chain release factor N(5)-glutamine methyltransferase [Candidatus Omnitrophota bacterium]